MGIAELSANAITVLILKNSSRLETSSYKKLRQFIKRHSKTSSSSSKIKKLILRVVIAVKTAKITIADAKKWVENVPPFVDVPIV